MPIQLEHNKNGRQFEVVLCSVKVLTLDEKV